MQTEFGSSLNTVFVECQGNDQPAVDKLALKRKWFGSSAMWTSERPVRTNARGIPNYVLLSPTGEVVMMGNPIRDHKKIEEYLTQFRKEKLKAPADMPKQLHGAWKNVHKGKLAAAAKDAARYAQSDDAAIVEAAESILKLVGDSIGNQLNRIDQAIEDGYFDFASDFAKDLWKRAKGSEYQAKIEERIARLESEELAAEVKAEKSLMKIEKGLYTKGVDKRSGKKLAKFVKKNQGTKAAERAYALAVAIGE